MTQDRPAEKDKVAIPLSSPATKEVIWDEADEDTNALAPLMRPETETTQGPEPPPSMS